MVIYSSSIGFCVWMLIFDQWKLTFPDSSLCVPRVRFNIFQTAHCVYPVRFNVFQTAHYVYPESDSPSPRQLIMCTLSDSMSSRQLITCTLSQLQHLPDSSLCVPSVSFSISQTAHCVYPVSALASSRQLIVCTQCQLLHLPDSSLCVPCVNFSIFQTASSLCVPCASFIPNPYPLSSVPVELRMFNTWGALLSCCYLISSWSLLPVCRCSFFLSFFKR